MGSKRQMDVQAKEPLYDERALYIWELERTDTSEAQKSRTKGKCKP